MKTQTRAPNQQLLLQMTVRVHHQPTYACLLLQHGTHAHQPKSVQPMSVQGLVTLATAGNSMTCLPCSQS